MCVSVGTAQDHELQLLRGADMDLQREHRVKTLRHRNSEASTQVVSTKVSVRNSLVEK